MHEGDENAAPPAPPAGRKRGRAANAAEGFMPPPAPRGRGKKAAAAAAAGALRQPGIAEAFSRGSQGPGAGSGGTTPAGRTGSNLDGYLQAGQSGAGPGVQSPNSQTTSSRSRTAGSSRAPRGRGGRGSRGGRSSSSSKIGRGGRQGAACARHVLDSDEELLGDGDEISDEDDDVDEQLPAKRARGEKRTRVEGLAIVLRVPGSG
jgi:hypothetical protein